jgi:hypothetical protein
LAVPRAANADVQYTTAGEDVYRIESSSTVSRVSYAGTERLAIRRQGNAVRFEAQAHYTRIAPEGKSSADALFVQILGADGSLENRVDDDPDFLTILNQPFAVQLDGATLRDVRQLRGRVPFTARSPVGGAAALRGFLRPETGGPISGRSTVAVAFQAQGPMNGTLPGHAGAMVSGTLQMMGTAYYADDDAMLLALNVTLTIQARLHERGATPSVPVRIVYRRSIRAAPARMTVKNLKNFRTRPRVRLAAGGGTVARSAR